MPRKDWVSRGMNGDHIPITIRPRRSFRPASGDPHRQTSRWPPAIYNGKNGGTNGRINFHEVAILLLVRAEYRPADDHLTMIACGLVPQAPSLFFESNSGRSGLPKFLNSANRST